MDDPRRRGSALDAVERGVNLVELDPTNPSVGVGGLPDEEGEVTQDAMIFWGPPHTVGAVGCIKRIKRPISVARKVMERTSHTLLVGDDATRFARKVGFVEEPLGTDASRRAWEAWQADPQRLRSWTHDTIGMVARDAQGNLCAGTSTSGKAFKIKGRVGDVPIPGAGAYVDNDVGGVAATGDGDVMMRFALAFAAVEAMRAGAGPDEACARARPHRGQALPRTGLPDGPAQGRQLRRRTDRRAAVQLRSEECTRRRDSPDVVLSPDALHAW